MRTGKSLHDKTRKVLLIAFAMLFALSCVTASAVYQSASAKDSDSARNVKAAAAAETGFDPKGGKTIDYLGDDGSNPDTSLRGEDFYRLYLDFPGKTKTSTETTTEKQNVDVIFCLDFSASMDSAMSAADSTKRYEAMANIMTSDTVKKILDDPNNKVSVVGFYGNSQERLYISGTLQAGYYYTPSGGSLCPQNSKINPLFKDAETLFDWTNNKDVFSKLHDDIITKFTELNGEISQSSKHLRYMQGTNYTAGFRQMLSQLKEVQDDGNKKILVFLSDGVPTYYFPDIDVKANQDKIDQAKQYAGALVHGRYGNGSEVNCPVTGEGSDQLYPKNLETNCYGTLNVWNGSNQDKVNEIKGEIESYGYHGTDDYGHTINQISNIYTPDKGQVQQKLRDMDMNLTTYTIGVSNEFDPAKDGSSYDGYVVTDEKGITKCGGNPYVLKQMADTESDVNTPGKFFEATNSQELQSAFGEIVNSTKTVTTTYVDKVSNVAITDNLSKYVRYYGAQPDLKVTMQRVADDNGKVLEDPPAPVTVWENGKAADIDAAQFTTADGTKKDIVQSVNYTADDSEGSDKSGTVECIFDPEYVMDGQYKFNVSFNVQASNEAYEEYAEKGGYNATGAKGTDYGTNKTSSGKPGFASNTSATASYTFEGKNSTSTYNKPVIQVGATDLKVTKTWKDSDGNPVTAGLPESITVHLLADGTDTGKTITLNADGEWSGTFNNLVPKKLEGDGKYTPIKYTVQEDKVDGYDADISYGDGSNNYFSDGNASDIQITDSEVKHVFSGGSAAGAAITNVKQKENAVTIKKAWVDPYGKPITDTSDLKATFQLKRKLIKKENTQQRKVTIKIQYFDVGRYSWGSWSSYGYGGSKSDKDYRDDDYYYSYYYVKLQPYEYNEDAKVIEVENGGSVDIDIKTNGEDDELGIYSVNSNKSELENLNRSDMTTDTPFLIDDNPRDLYRQEKYRLSNVTEDQTITVTVLGWLNPDKTIDSVPITYAVEKNDSEDQPGTVIGDEKYGEPITSQGNNWSHTWDNLPATDSDGNTYEYYVVESPLSDYQVEYQNNDGIKQGTIFVTNRKIKKYILPDTAGPGTFPFIMLGVGLIGAALLIDIESRRKEDD